MEQEVRLNVKLEADLLKQIKAVAKELGLNVSSLTRTLLINYLEAYYARKNSTNKE